MHIVGGAEWYAYCLAGSPWTDLEIPTGPEDLRALAEHLATLNELLLEQEGTGAVMDVVAQSERCIAFRVDPDAWKHPDIAWPNDDLIVMAAAAASSQSPSAFVSAVLGIILPGA